MKNLIKQYGKDGIMVCINTFFEDVDDFAEGVGCGIGLFQSRINRILISLRKPKIKGMPEKTRKMLQDIMDMELKGGSNESENI